MEERGFLRRHRRQHELATPLGQDPRHVLTTEGTRGSSDWRMTACRWFDCDGQVNNCGAELQHLRIGSSLFGGHAIQKLNDPTSQRQQRLQEPLHSLARWCHDKVVGSHSRAIPSESIQSHQSSSDVLAPFGQCFTGPRRAGGGLVRPREEENGPSGVGLIPLGVSCRAWSRTVRRSTRGFVPLFRDLSMRSYLQ